MVIPAGPARALCPRRRRPAEDDHGRPHQAQGAVLRRFSPALGSPARPDAAPAAPSVSSGSAAPPVVDPSAVSRPLSGSPGPQPTLGVNTAVPAFFPSLLAAVEGDKSARSDGLGAPSTEVPTCPGPHSCLPQVQTRKEEPLPPAASRSIPTFYFPRGRPQDTVNIDAVITKIERTFAQFPHERATIDDMGRVAKACGCPLYWKGPLFCSAGGERTGSVSVHKFVAMWRKVLQNCHDDAAKFVHLLMSPGCSYLVQEDFVPFLQDVVNTHPGLAFLKEAAEFHSRYITTVIQRIFYTVNRSWSGRITCAELRRSTFLQNVALLEEEADINQLTEFFSYEHFYVIYCKFWELDTDHDLLIDAQDLARHNDHAISTKMIDRIFSGAVTRGKKVQKEGKISYADFVWFLISEEDKKTPTSIEYWFRCMDLDGDGALSMFELEYFYEEQCRRLDSMAIEALPFEDCLCQMLDLVKPQTEGRITLQDLKRCKLANVFFDTFFNIEKYLDHEQKEQASLLRESDSEGPELSDWERFAAEEYDILVAEEAAGDPWEDGYEAELSPMEQKLSALRSPLAQRPFLEAPGSLGAVELYEYECGDDDLPPS
ncbi:PREDICTED: serine/threonine-protein phosphatase 2A regulatory subunit B'' subunit beta [Bison bison bison]|uniref:Serine/threonine-protein phosphatase 2A regulatory subunit B'' subunit beta n=1 Tax=Bison bison bison TaxID=43346 RepID=A0A6P3GRA9_BISBB|nr:PREDICTED: serine/threonine-protein phosphatase 2A regulatory subunit B'' subunit beta [Bison bison bison]